MNRPTQNTEHNESSKTVYPQYQQMPQQPSFDDDEIDLLELWQAIYKRKWLISGLAFGLAFVLAAYSLTLPNKYKASVLMAPVSSGGGGLGGLAAKYGGLASMAGISLPSGESGETEEAISTITSKKFLYPFIKESNLKPFLFPDDWDTDTQKWIEKPPGLVVEIKESLLGKAESVIPEEFQEPLAVGEPTSFEAYEELIKLLSISTDKNNGFVTLSLELTDPILSMTLSNQLVKEINQQLRQQQIDQSKKTIQYLREALPKVKLVELKEIIFSMIEDNAKNMALAETREDYVFKVIDPAVIPEEKSGPKRGLMVAVGFVLGLMLGIFMALILHWREKNKSGISNVNGDNTDVKNLEDKIPQ